MVKRKSSASHAEPAADLSSIAEALRPLAVSLDELVPDPANARTHSERNLEAIRGSLQVYGQLKPIVVRRDNGVVVAGNGTLEAARSLGWTHLAVVHVDMDGATAAGFSIADNRTAELAEWDQDALDKLLREINTGNDPRLDAMLAELATEQQIIPPEESIPRPQGISQPASSSEQGPILPPTNPSEQASFNPSNRDGQTEPYQPVLDPQQARSGVSADDIQEAQEELQDKIENTPALTPVICPTCANEFYVDPKSLMSK